MVDKRLTAILEPHRLTVAVLIDFDFARDNLGDLLADFEDLTSNVRRCGINWLSDFGISGWRFLDRSSGDSDTVGGEIHIEVLWGYKQVVCDMKLIDSVLWFALLSCCV